MFKNRIRTAAIAGIAALATGISGTVVATAQVNDGSNQTEVSAADRYDLDLARANDAVRDDIRAIQADPIYAQTVVNRHALIAGDFDQSEESLAARIGELRTEVQGLLEEAVANVDTAREGVIDAQEKDQATREALAAWGEEVAALSNYIHDGNQSFTTIIPEDGGTVDVTTDGLTIIEKANSYEGVDISEDVEDADVTAYRVNGETIDLADTGIVNIEDAIETLTQNDGQADVLQDELSLWDTTDLEDLTAVQDAVDYLDAWLESVALPGTGGYVYAEETLLGQIERAQEDLQDRKAEITDIINEQDGEVLDNPIDVETSEAMKRENDEAVAYLAELRAAIEGDVDAIEAAQDAYDDAAWAATGANYASRVRALQDATSQRNVLRGLDGYLAGTQKYIELYGNDVLTGDQTLRQQYYDAILETEYDVRINGENVVNEGAGAAVELGVEQVIIGAHVGAMDDFLNDFGRLGLVEQAIIDALTPEEDETEEPTPGEGSDREGGSSFEAPDFRGGSSDLGGFGIAAVIAAIIGVLALVVPNIQNFL